MVNLFGEQIIEDVLLRERFIEPPFSVLDTKGGEWQNRKRKWLAIGLKSEIGRDANVYNNKKWLDSKEEDGLKGSTDTSIFCPALTELIYRWFAPEGGRILDPFAGGSVRGIVANYLGYSYTGIDLRQEQIEANREQALKILPVTNQPNFYIGDSDEVLSLSLIHI